VSKGRDTVSNRRLTHLVRLLGVFEGLPGMLVSGFIFRFALLFPGAVGVGGKIVQFRGPLVIFVMGSVVVSGGHDLEGHDLPGLRVGFFGKLVGTV